MGLEKFRIPSSIGGLLFGVGSKVSDQYFQPHAGGDMAFLKATQAYLLKEGLVNEAFVEAHCSNWEEFRKELKKVNINRLLERSGLEFEEMQDFCDYLGGARNIIFSWAMGITHQKHGVESVREIANLALLLGSIGRPGAGLLPLRGHSNVQGIGTVGVVPRLKPRMVERLIQTLSVDIPDQKGMDTYSCMVAAHRGEIDFALLLGGNLYGSNPDSRWAAEALGRIPFTVTLSTTLNLGHVFGRGEEALILPVRARDEEKQATSQESMFNYVRLSEGGQKPPVGDLPSEVEVLSRIGRKLLGDDPVNWKKMGNHRIIRRYIARTVPGMKKLAKLDDAGDEFSIAGRILHRPRFNTEDGKALLSIARAPDARPAKNEFNLLTFRSEGQFNTIVYDDYDLYRGVSHRDLVFMNREDMEARGLEEGDRVTVRSSVGELQVEAVEGPIRAGNVAMYFPESNVLVPRIQDPQSLTPVFKRVAVAIKHA